VPGKILDDLEIEPYRTIDFSLADGTKITRRVEADILNTIERAALHRLFMAKKETNHCWE
jgi:hypothetical protein